MRDGPPRGDVRLGPADRLTQFQLLGVQVSIHPLTTGDPIALELHLGSPGALSGTVTDEESDEPLAGAYLEAIQRGGALVVGFGSAYTDSQGQYLIEGLEGGEYEVTVFRAGYSPRTEAGVQVSAGGPATLDLALGWSGSIRGKVSSGDDPIAGAYVRAIQTDADTVAYLLAEADEEGKYVFPDLAAPGHYRLETDVDGCTDAVMADLYVQPQ